MEEAGKMFGRIRRFLKGNIPFYLLGILAILGMKLFYSRAGSDGLRWILAPTARWVELLSGIPFEYEQGAGYVNHSLRYLIAPSCAGINFMVIIMAALFFPFLHRLKAPEGEQGEWLGKGLSVFWRKACWTGGSLLFSYLITILVNGLRILAAVYLPDFFSRAGLLGGFLSEERLHIMIGVVIYFVCLLTVYRLTDCFVCRLAGEEEAVPERGGSRKGIFGVFKGFLAPVFWYFCIALGLPFAGRAYRGESAGYGEYALPVILAVGVALAVCVLGRLAWGKVRKICRGSHRVN